MEASSGDEQPSSEGTGVLTGPESELSAGEPARIWKRQWRRLTGHQVIIMFGNFKHIQHHMEVSLS